MSANSDDPDHTSHYALSGLGLHCLPMSNKRDARYTYRVDCVFESECEILILFALASSKCSDESV